MSTDEELRFSFRADVPKENIQVLDTVLNELFGSLSNKMKEAGEFLENVKMRPPTIQTEDSNDAEDASGDESGGDSGDTEEEYDGDTDGDSSDEEEDSQVDEEEEDVDEEEEESQVDVDYVFLIRENGEITGFSDTLLGAMDFLDKRYQEVVVRSQGMVRTERNTTEIRGYRQTPYLWFMFSERLIYHGKIEVVIKV
jgi:hypothetical protein